MTDDEREIQLGPDRDLAPRERELHGLRGLERFAELIDPIRRPNGLLFVFIMAQLTQWGLIDWRNDPPPREPPWPEPWDVRITWDDEE